MDGVSADDVLDAAATAELRSEHPLGQAIAAHARAKGRTIAEPDSFKYMPGRGIAAEVGSSMILIGNRAWMQDREVTVPANVSHGIETASRCSLPATVASKHGPGSRGLP